MSRINPIQWRLMMHQLSLFGPVQLGLFDGHAPELTKPPALWPPLDPEDLTQDEWARLVADRGDV